MTQAHNNANAEMDRPALRLDRFALLMLAGLAAIAFAFSADWIGVSSAAGFGRSQIAALAVGCGMFLLGVGLDLSIGRRASVLWLPEAVADAGKLARYLAVGAQLGLLVLVFRAYHLEVQAFYDGIAPLVLAGFLIHHLLPQRWKLPFFVLLSFAGLLVVFHPGDAAALVAAGLVLIGICHLPLAHATRVAILFAAGIGLVLMRVGWIPSILPDTIWPILGSMFAFRLIVYMYDLQHKKTPLSVWATLSYFFLLPNVTFPMFPIVDYSTFRRTYYDKDAFRIYQKGIQWMLLGVVHLLVYRMIYQNMVVPADAVRDVDSLVRYVAPNFLFILRLSGQFHLIIGILHLFGFNLPVSMDWFLLPSNFADFWRRANVYWKDFMVKVFFYPCYFRLRKLPETGRLIVSMAVVFTVTWFFHAFQWLWIRGSFLWNGPDITFWTAFGILATASAVWDSKRSKKTLGPRSRSLKDSLWLSARILGTLTVICLLWSVWISESLAAWWSLWPAVAWTGPAVARLAEWLVAAYAVILGGVTLQSRLSTKARTPRTPVPFSFRTSASVSGAFVLLFLFGGVSEALYWQLDDDGQRMLQGMRSATLNQVDENLLTRGYYEELNGVDRFNPELWQLYMQKPSDWVAMMTVDDLVRRVNGFVRHEMRPSVDVLVNGVPYVTNRWGMRDQDYELTPPPDVYRIAMLGSSITMASGVVHEDSFEARLEERLNNEPVHDPGTRYEILNFAMYDYTDIVLSSVLAEKVLAFHPDAVFAVSHPDKFPMMIEHLALRVTEGRAIPYPELAEIIARAGVDAQTPPAEARRRLLPFAAEINQAEYRRVVELCRENGILPVWISVPGAAALHTSAAQ